MAEYRLYLRDAFGILGRDEFEAGGDEEAGVLAALICEACSDACECYELWQGSRRVQGGRPTVAGPLMYASGITARMQESLIAREEAIQSSRWAVSRSRRLMERINALRPVDKR
jgi:hypothetical protein